MYIRNESGKDYLLEDYFVKIYTVRSKMYCGCGSDIFSDDLAINSSLRLPQECRLFQAEIYTICPPNRLSNDRRFIQIFVNSQGELLFPKSLTITSLQISECKEELDWLDNCVELSQCRSLLIETTLVSMLRVFPMRFLTYGHRTPKPQSLGHIVITINSYLVTPSSHTITFARKSGNRFPSKRSPVIKIHGSLYT